MAVPRSPPECERRVHATAIAIGLLAIYLLALAVALLLFRHRVDVSALQALNGAFPNMAQPVLVASAHICQGDCCKHGE